MKRNRTIALILLFVIVFIIVKSCTGGGDADKEESSSSAAENLSSGTEAVTGSSSETENSGSSADSSADNSADSSAEVSDSSLSESSDSSAESHTIEVSNGMTFVDGILIVNKTYSLPADYDPGVSAVAQNAFDRMAAAAQEDGLYLFINSGYRSYAEQESLYNMYASERGTDEADKVSSRPGHSEHQTGLTFDVNSTEFSFGDTEEAKWLAEHCAEYGFIIRYPEGKEDITGYAYEPWHIRYLGSDIAQAVTESGLCLEEYLGITSDYRYADDGTAELYAQDGSYQGDGSSDGYSEDSTEYTDHGY